MQRIDAHYHMTRTARFVRYENLEDMLEYKKQAGLSAICVHNIVFWDTKRYLLNPLALLAKAKDPQGVYAFGGIVYPELEDQWKPHAYEKQAEELLKMGFDGIKILNKPSFKKEWQIPYCHENFDRFWGYLEEKQVPVMFHIGDPKEFWKLDRVPKAIYDLGWYYDKDCVPYEFFYEETEGILKKFPKLNLTIPHFYFLSDDLKRLDEFMQAYPQIRIDITPGSEMYYNFSICQDAARDFFVKYQDRILFGTDNYGSQTEGGREAQIQKGINRIKDMEAFLSEEFPIFEGERLRGLALPKEVQEKIQAKNFLNWVTGTADKKHVADGENMAERAVGPKKADVESMMQMTKELYERAKQKGDSPDSLVEFEKALHEMQQL